MENDTQVILGELHKIKENLEYIKEHMVERDEILTSEEKILLEKARAEYAQGKTTSLEQLEKELGINV